MSATVEPPVGSRWQWNIPWKGATIAGHKFTIIELADWDDVAGIHLTARILHDGEERPHLVGVRGIIEGAERLPSDDYQRGRADERAAVVAWLRDQARETQLGTLVAATYDTAADMIGRADPDHIPSTTPETGEGP